MIRLLIEYLFIFIVGAMGGWCLEVIYRKFLGKARKWINPGFLSGPYLPLYGSGVTMLYLISDIQMPLWVKVIAFAVITTGIEYLTGLFFLKVYNTRLWDYSRLKFNVQGIISPLYTVLWVLLSMFYYYILYPRFHGPIAFILGHLEYSLFVGVLYGIFVLDVIQSFNVLNRIRAMARALGQTQIAINYEQLKLNISERFDELTVKVESIGEKVESISEKVVSNRPKLRRPSFLRPFGGDYNMRSHLQAHFERVKKESIERIKKMVDMEE